MEERSLERFRVRLTRLRRDLVQHHSRSTSGVQELRAGAPGPEYEEGAQAGYLESLLTRLSESQREEVRLVDEALERLDAGTFGWCRECAGEIERERLDALPFARLCAECAEDADRAKAQRGTFAPTLAP